jgi:hypothetical protein
MLRELVALRDHSPTLEQLAELLCCPITHQRLRNPVLASDCHTYEQEALQAWLDLGNGSPVTREPLAIVPDKVLQQVLQVVFPQEVPGDEASVVPLGVRVQIMTRPFDDLCGKLLRVFSVRNLCVLRRLYPWVEHHRGALWELPGVLDPLMTAEDCLPRLSTPEWPMRRRRASSLLLGAIHCAQSMPYHDHAQYMLLHLMHSYRDRIKWLMANPNPSWPHDPMHALNELNALALRATERVDNFAARWMRLEDLVLNSLKLSGSCIDEVMIVANDLELLCVDAADEVHNDRMVRSLNRRFTQLRNQIHDHGSIC